MQNDTTDGRSNIITLNGITFKTNGNILFSDCDESPFHLAQSPLLKTLDGILEHGMQMLLKKATIVAKIKG